MKYAFIQRYKLVWPICVQCHVLLVSVSGYHQHLARRKQIASRRHLSDEALLVHISAVYAEMRGAYGWPRIWRQLRAQGIRVGKQRVQRLMQQHGIHARGKRKFRVTTTDSKHNLPIAPNILNCIFTLAAPNQAWVRWSSHLERSQSSTCGSRRTLTACRRAAVPDSRAVLRSAAKSRKVIPPRHLMPLAASFAHNYPPPAHNSSSQSCERGILVPCRGPGEGSLLAWVPVP